jgi:acylphosphatase
LKAKRVSLKKKDEVVIQRAHVYFSGRVQGVGFRFTAERFAQELGLCGWVKNLPDGRVEVVCEGPKGKIEAFLERIRASSLGLHIKKAACEWGKPTNEFKDFSIEFCL